MSIRLRTALVAVTVGGLAACASIVGLDHSDPTTTTALLSDGGTAAIHDDSGIIVGTGSVTTEAGVTITPDNIDFQKVGCGIAQSTAIVMRSASDADAPYTITLPPGGVFTLDGADGNGVVTGMLVAHGEASVRVSATSRQPGDASADIQVQVGSDNRVVTATLETTGAGLAFTPPSLDFGNVRQGTESAPQQVTFSNTGNDEIDFSGFSGADDFTLPGFKLMPNSTITEMVTMKAGDAGMAIAANAVPIVTAGLQCGTLPSLSLKGTRVDTTVTVNPATLDLGAVSCGASPVTGMVTISNFSQQNAIPFTTTLTGTHFSVGTPSGNVPAATGAGPGKVAIPVSIKAVGTTPGPITNEFLTVTFTPDGGSQQTTKVALTYDVQGAIVAFAKSSVTLRDNYYTSVGVTNTGNQTICVKYTSDNDQIVFQNPKMATITSTDKTQVVNPTFENSNSNSNNTGTVSIAPYACPGSAAITALCTAAPKLTVVGQLY